MSKWRKLTLTNDGAKLLANVTANNLPLVLSCIKFGTGQYDETVVMREMEQLAAEKQTIGISRKEIVNKTTCKITGIITNTGLNSGYYLRELGIYAIDADNNEVLFMVNYDDVPDYMPAENDGSAVEQEFSVYITLNNEANVQLSVNYDALAMKDEVDKLGRDINQQNTQNMKIIESRLCNKANCDLDNLSEAGKNRLGDTIIDYDEDLVNKTWYRKWKSGWLEQGGDSRKPNKGSVTINLLKPYINTNYSVSLTSSFVTTSASVVYIDFIALRTTTNITIRSENSDAAGSYSVMWYACGKGVAQ